MLYEGRNLFVTSQVITPKYSFHKTFSIPNNIHGNLSSWDNKNCMDLTILTCNLPIYLPNIVLLYDNIINMS